MPERYNKLPHKIAAHLFCTGYSLWGVANTFMPGYEAPHATWQEVKGSMVLANKTAQGKRIHFADIIDGGLYRSIHPTGKENISKKALLLVANELLHGPGREFGPAIGISYIVEMQRSGGNPIGFTDSTHWFQASEGETWLSRSTTSVVNYRMQQTYQTIPIKRPQDKNERQTELKKPMALAVGKLGDAIDYKMRQAYEVWTGEKIADRPRRSRLGLGKNNPISTAEKILKEGGVVGIYPEGHKGHLGVSESLSEFNEDAIRPIAHLLKLRERGKLDFDLLAVGTGIRADGSQEIALSEPLDVTSRDNVGKTVMESIARLVRGGRRGPYSYITT